VKAIKALWTDEAGVTTVEYALLLAVLVVGAATIWTALSQCGNRLTQNYAQTRLLTRAIWQL